MLTNFVNCILLSLLVHLAFWTSIFFTCGVGIRDVHTLTLPSRVEDAVGLCRGQAKLSPEQMTCAHVKVSS